MTVDAEAGECELTEIGLSDGDQAAAVGLSYQMAVVLGQPAFGTRGRKQVVIVPRMSKRSFHTIGTPSSALRRLPSLWRRWLFSACSRASSSVAVIGPFSTEGRGRVRPRLPLTGSP
jgi:hypothetical protein